ncbi:MAG: hypothetical protein U0K71_12260 [Paludibacteraceae bacterium]|jgi:hypothetical protein|nr:hypothetical protein [Paludibacteraceae bacterium]
MNKFLHYWTAMAVALSSIAFTACGDDDDEDDDNNGTVVNNNDNGGNTNNGGNENGNNGGNGDTNKLQGLVGTWILDEKATTVDIKNITGEMESDPWSSLIFNADGTFSIITEDEDNMEGKYSVDGDKLILEIIDEDGPFTLKEGVDYAQYLMGEDAADYGMKMLVTKQSISISDDILHFEQGWDNDIWGNAAIIMIHGVYNRQK